MDGSTIPSTFWEATDFLKDYQDTAKLDSTASPLFCTARSLPLVAAAKESVVSHLDRESL
jgi:hypothetical protein